MAKSIHKLSLFKGYLRRLYSFASVMFKKKSPVLKPANDICPLIADIARKSVVELKKERDAIKSLGSSASDHSKIRLQKLNERLSYLDSVMRINKWLMTETPDHVYQAYEDLTELYTLTSKRYPTPKEEKRMILLQERVRPYSLYIRLLQDNSMWSSEYRLRHEYYILPPRDPASREFYKKSKEYPGEWMFMNLYS